MQQAAGEKAKATQAAQEKAKKERPTITDFLAQLQLGENASALEDVGRETVDDGRETVDDLRKLTKSEHMRKVLQHFDGFAFSILSVLTSATPSSPIVMAAVVSSNL